jgi:hypothetical protein
MGGLNQTQACSSVVESVVLLKFDLLSGGRCGGI